MIEKLYLFVLYWNKHHKLINGLKIHLKVFYWWLLYLTLFMNVWCCALQLLKSNSVMSVSEDLLSSCDPPAVSERWLSQRWASPTEDLALECPQKRGWEVALEQIRMVKQSMDYIRKAERTGCDWCLSKTSRDWKTSQKQGHWGTQAGHPEGWVWGLSGHRHVIKKYRGM